MAFTGKKYKGSRIYTPETIENNSKFYRLMSEIKKANPEEELKLKEQMFYDMFGRLSHSAQREILQWAYNANWDITVMERKVD